MGCKTKYTGIVGQLGIRPTEGSLARAGRVGR